MQPLINLVDVPFHGPYSDVQSLGDCAAAGARYNFGDDGPLPARQRHQLHRGRRFRSLLHSPIKFLRDSFQDSALA